MNTTESNKKSEVIKLSPPMPDYTKVMHTMSSSMKRLLSGATMWAALTSIGYIMYKRPTLEIKKYNSMPRMKKPRKARRILRRRKQLREITI